MSSSVQVCAVGVGDDAGDLDRNVRPARDLGDPLAPRMLLALFDLRRAAMVEHELHVGAEVDERDRLVDLVGPNAEVERSAGAREPRDIGAKDRRQAHLVGDDMQHAAEALDQRIGELALEKGGKIRPLRAAGADRADAAGSSVAVARRPTCRVSASI